MGDRDQGDVLEAGIECRSWTHARRHPKLIGKFQGWKLPFMISLAQLVVIVVGIIVLVWTRAWWALIVTHAPEQILLILGLPITLAYVLRHVRMEGRAPLRMLFGVLGYANRRAIGPENAGRSQHSARRPARMNRASVWVTAADRSLPAEAPAMAVLEPAAVSEGESPAPVEEATAASVICSLIVQRRAVA